MTFYWKPVISILIYNHYFSGWLEDISNKPRLKNGSKSHNNFMFKSYMYMLSGCELIDTENISLPNQNMKFGGE
jgi:hypothetical protein